uniref:Kunitz-like toxin PcKuz3 n=1 Tax=Palythoa caribaeorum TaxID=134933 RepID=VKT3_PALCA|nr:RecName: Full=Kunitz-like toxin PcKuz3; AltName: Full=Kunitz-type serine protease inhibitor PcKuz3; AltName: Full=PI-sphenopitoxin-Pc1c; Short=PI-SPTX-Pc1c [Palythoa caribaeorum]
CQQPVKPGLCEAYIPRFFYNTSSKQCEKFIYGGCGGNSNRFLTMKACQDKC